MKLVKSNRGFFLITHPKYPPDGTEVRVIQESSAIDLDIPDGYDCPGSSYLWIGDNLHLNRTQVAELIEYMHHWLDKKRLFDPQHGTE